MSPLVGARISITGSADTLPSSFIVREFKWDDDAREKQREEVKQLEVEEKELWVSACFAIAWHKKTHRAESDAD